jgi:hypothetical protein
VVGALDNNDAANLNEAPVGSLNQCFAHVAGCLVMNLLVVSSMKECEVVVGGDSGGRDRAYRSKLFYPFEVVGGYGAAGPAGRR